jgi:hypothetical protein
VREKASATRIEMQGGAQFPLDRGAGVIVRDDGRIETSAIVDVLDHLDDRFGAEPVPARVSSRSAFAVFGRRTGTS